MKSNELNELKELADNFILACQFMNLDSKKFFIIKGLKIEVEHTKNLGIYNIISKHKKNEHRYENVDLMDLHKIIYQIIRDSAK